MMRLVLFVALLVYGIPLWKLRYRWRSTLYRRSDWKINVLPWFGRDTAALFTNAWFRDEAERRMAARYRWYVLGYVALLAGFLWLP
ncbi:MAG: hypothetical protein OXH04_13040 [Acidobacteria bacterium]|nr:hypothetical protein [Acidobacteriota bacterium]